jgi:hypothetical protein
MFQYTRSVRLVQSLHFRPTFSPLVFLVRATHQTFSDYNVILPRFFTGKDSVELLNKISELSVAFLDDRMEDALAHSVTREMKVETVKGWRGREQRQLVARAGDVLVH